MRICVGVDRSAGLAGRLAVARAVAESAGRALIKEKSEGIASIGCFRIGASQTCICATAHCVFISDGALFYPPMPRIAALVERVPRFSPYTAYRLQSRIPAAFCQLKNSLHSQAKQRYVFHVQVAQPQRYWPPSFCSKDAVLQLGGAAGELPAKWSPRVATVPRRWWRPWTIPDFRVWQLSISTVSRYCDANRGARLVIVALSLVGLLDSGRGYLYFGIEIRPWPTAMHIRRGTASLLSRLVILIV